MSGASDYDYPTLATQVPALANLPYVGGFKHTPLPPELLEHFDRILTGCSPVQLPHWVFPCTVTSPGVPLYSYLTGQCSYSILSRLHISLDLCVTDSNVGVDTDIMAVAKKLMMKVLSETCNLK